MTEIPLTKYLELHGHLKTAKRYGISSTNLTRWKREGYTAITRRGKLVKINKPEMTVWSAAKSE